MAQSSAERWQHKRYGEQNRAANRALAAAAPPRRRRTSAGGGGEEPVLMMAAVVLPNTTEIPARDSGVIWGIDISPQWDGTPDMQCLKDRGGRFVYIKAADGQWAMPKFEPNAANARAAGLVTGAYFWLYPDSRISCTGQATKWWDIVKDLDLDFHVVDFEWTSWSGAPANPTTSDLRIVVDKFQQLSGKALWIYTAPGYANQYFNHQERYRANPLVEAHYQVHPWAIAPWGENGHTIHQISESWPGAELGVDPACAREVDGDIFNGDDAQFLSTFHLVLEAREWRGQKTPILTSPQSGSANSGLPGIEPGATVRYIRIVDDLQHPDSPYYKWLQLDANETQFVRYFYPPSGKRFELLPMRRDV